MVYNPGKVKLIPFPANNKDPCNRSKNSTKLGHFYGLNCLNTIATWAEVAKTKDGSLDNFLRR